MVKKQRQYQNTALWIDRSGAFAEQKIRVGSRQPAERDLISFAKEQPQQIVIQHLQHSNVGGDILRPLGKRAQFV